MAYIEEFEKELRLRLEAARLKFIEVERACEAEMELSIKSETWEYPMQNVGVYAILGFIGFDISQTPSGWSFYNYAFRSGIIDEKDRPYKEKQRLYWREDQVIRFGVALEKCRHWRPCHYDRKKTPFELDDELEKLKIDVELHRRWGAMDIAQLYRELAQSDSALERDRIYRYICERSSLFSDMAFADLSECLNGLKNVVLTEKNQQIRNSIVERLIRLGFGIEARDLDLQAKE